MDALRPVLRLFTDEQVDRIVEDALLVLEATGFYVENEEALEILAGEGLRVVKGRVFAPPDVVKKALPTAPSRIPVYDRDGELALDLSGDRVHFDPGSAAIFFLDPQTRRNRAPVTPDLVHLAWVTQ